MMEAPEIFNEIALIIFSGVMVSFLFLRLKLPAVSGFLVAGILIGPMGFGLVKHSERLSILAEIGVVFLLFSVGLEFPLQRFRKITGWLALGGVLQVVLTTLVTVFVLMFFGIPWNRALFFGFVISHSSTAIVLKTLIERNEFRAPHGRFVLGVTIFQDLFVVPMILMIPALGGITQNQIGIEILLAFLKAALFVAVSLGIARFGISRLFGWIDSTRSSELFVLGVAGVCIGTAWITNFFGLSLALGAFIAGMMLADSDFRHRAVSEILPFRDVLISFFFISLGMLFDPQFLRTHSQMVLFMVFVFLVGKGLLASLSVILLKFPARIAWLAGVGLAQFGEFGFVVLTLGQSHGLVSLEETQLFLVSGILSMLINPFAVRLAPHVMAGERLLHPLSLLLGVRDLSEAVPEEREIDNHVVIAGFGTGGRTLAMGLRQCKIPYLILELNADTVRQAREMGEPIYYGDASSLEVLKQANVSKARMVALVFNDAQAIRRTIDSIRRLSLKVSIVARTPFLQDRVSLLSAGVSDVVVEELEAGIEVVAIVLRKMGVARNIIGNVIHEARLMTVVSNRELTIPRPRLGEMADLADLKIERFYVRETSFVKGKNVSDLKLRNQTGTLIVARRNKTGELENIDPSVSFRTGDILYLVGSLSSIHSAIQFLEEGHR